ncbi:MAG: ribbon-helix-helix protein, CopG family [Deltaproteobacteria bacterium]|nr:ribbon-helix-helix protein, CopG family [Deltaproteobacteria bacterium]
MKQKILLPVTISIERDDLKTIRHLAVDQEVSVTAIVRGAVEKFLADQKAAKAGAQPQQAGS